MLKEGHVTSNLKILFMLDYAETGGGATRMMLWVASSMADLGCEVSLCSISRSRFLEESLPPACSYHSFDAPPRTQTHKRNPAEETVLFSRIRAFMRSERPNVVVSFGGHEFYYALALRHSCGYKLLVSERADPYHPRSKGDRIRRALYNRADFAAFQTPEAMRYFSPSLQRRAAVIPNPAKRSFAESWAPSRSKTIATLSRIDLFQKRLDIVVEAIALMETEAELRIYGGGPQPELDKLESLIGASPAKGRIRLMGPVESPEAAFEGADVYVLCSDYEGIPNTVMEALSYGIPVISTDCSPGGARLLLDCGRYGTIVPCGDARALARALDDYFRAPAPAIAKAERGVESVSRFDGGAIAKAWLDAFRMTAGDS